LAKAAPKEMGSAKQVQQNTSWVTLALDTHARERRLMSLHILLTGGTGYIGSHTCVELLQGGHRVTLLDNLSNSSELVVHRLEAITGRRPGFIKADLCDEATVDQVLATGHFDAVIHFAGLKAVGESVKEPLRYWHNNVGGSCNLLRAMDRHGVRKLVFSSSATVYGEPESLPLTETARVGPTNPYGSTKLVTERLLADLGAGNPDWRIASLRYFNPVGAHASGLIGENPRGIPNNLMPYVGQVASGKLPFLSVFGNDYPTPDGTGVRDYIHVVDLARGHVAALQALAAGQRALTLNLGTGRGHSVLEVVRAYEKACGHAIPVVIKPRRGGDVAESWADTSRATAVLGWRAELDLDRMCADAWRWQAGNPDGYR